MHGGDEKCIENLSWKIWM